MGRGKTKTIGIPLKGHREDFPEVRSVAFSPDGNLFISGSGFWYGNGYFVDESSIQLWDVAKQTALGRALFTDLLCLSVSFSSDSRHLMAANRNGSVQVWNVSTTQAMKHHC